MRGVVVGDHDGVVVDANVAFEPVEKILGQMAGVPGLEGFGEALAELVESGLGEQGHGHLSVADVEVEGSGAVPSKVLVGVEEFLDAPALGIVAGEQRDLVVLAGGEKCLVAIVGRGFAGSLNELMDGDGGVLKAIGTNGGGVSGPSGSEEGGIEGFEFAVGGLLAGLRDEQIETALGDDAFEQVGAEVFGVDKNKGFFAVAREDIVEEAEKGESGRSGGAGGGGEGEDKRLGGVGVDDKKGLGVFDRGGVGGEGTPPHLALGIAAHAVGIDGEEFAAEMAAGVALVSEGDLEGLGLGDGVGGKQHVNGLVGGDEGKAVGDLESLLAEDAALAQSRDAQGGLVDQLKGEAGLDALGRLPAPAAQKVPGAQAQMLGQKQPQADARARHLIGEDLTNAAFETWRIARFVSPALLGALGFHLDERGVWVGPGRVEFFFEGRSVR